MRAAVVAGGALVLVAAASAVLLRQADPPAWIVNMPGWAQASLWLKGERREKPDFQDTSRPTQPARPQVKVAAVRAETVPITLSGIGTVQAYNTVGVRSRIDGEITDIRFREGQDVKAGDALAVIDPRPLQAQVAQQEAMLAKNGAILAGALLDLNRAESLVKNNFASQQQVDQQRALVEQYRAQIRADGAQLDYVRTQLGYTTIVSPIAGRTGIRQIDGGNYVRAGGEGGTIVTVTQIRPISVVFTISATAVAENRLSLGEAKVPVVVFAADGTTMLDRGFVELVDNQVDPTTGTIKLKASFPNDALRLWPGTFVNGQITVETRRNAPTVPATALRHGPRGDFVFILKEDATVETRNVRAGQSAGGRVLVERGLRPGERVVTEGHFRLENGTAVEVLPGSPESDEPEGATGRAGRQARSPG